MGERSFSDDFALFLLSRKRKMGTLVVKTGS